MSLRKLAAQAHGEALTQLLGAWEKRDPAQVPSVQELGRVVSPAVRGAWSQSVGAAPTDAGAGASEALLRLEIAAEVPTPADQIDARRALQLKLLTKRNDPTPAQTWGEDAGKVLAAAHDANTARRLQNALKALLRK
jgi:ATP-dependent RNA helicase SUPV3L1/SUV3